MWGGVEEVHIEVGGFFSLVVEPEARTDFAASGGYRHFEVEEILLVLRYLNEPVGLEGRRAAFLYRKKGQRRGIY